MEKTWKIYITFFRKLYDDHYMVDRSYRPANFTFVKVNEEYQAELDGNRLAYDIFYENAFPHYRPDLQKKGYHENSVLYHIYKNAVHDSLDYIGFIEYDHVLADDFTRRIQARLDESPPGLILSFQDFTFHQLWTQGILMDPGKPYKLEGDPESPWNCINVILKDYNDFFGTDYGLRDLAAKSCFPICHSFLLPSATFGRIMKFHAFIMDSAKVEGYSRHNWRANAILMERYMAVALALEPGAIDNSIQLEHRSYPIKVLKPEWFKQSLRQRITAYVQRKF